MKTAVSILDEVFQDVERLARRLKKSRSELYSRTLAEYLARHSADRITESMDKVISEVGGGMDEFSSEAAHRVLERTEW